LSLGISGSILLLLLVAGDVFAELCLLPLSIFLSLFPLPFEREGAEEDVT
jgi:hypothetical protein